MDTDKCYTLDIFVDSLVVKYSPGTTVTPQLACKNFKRLGVKLGGPGHVGEEVRGRIKISRVWVTP